MKKKPGNKKTSRVLIFTVTAFCKKESVTYRCSWRIGTAVTASDEELKAVKKDLEKALAAAESAKGTYATFAAATDEQGAKTMFEQMSEGRVLSALELMMNTLNKYSFVDELFD
mgnify:CR=1 FL=1